MPRDGTELGLKTTPYWWEDAPLAATLPARPAPTSDVVVIGAGYSGLSAALTLARAGRSVQVLDAGTPGVGASSRNGGMCGDGLKPGLDALSRRYGRAHAIALLTEAQRALAWLGDFIADERIECDFRRTGSFVGALLPAQYEAMARDTDRLRREIGLEADMVAKSAVHEEIGTDLYVGGRIHHRRAGLHPARYHAALMQRVTAAGATIIGDCPVTAIRREQGYRIATPAGVVQARDVVVATNGYTGPVTGWLRRRVIPVTSTIIATAKLTEEVMARLMPKGRMLSDGNRLLCYFRPAPDNSRILFGGRPAYHDIAPERAAGRLQRYMATIFPELRDVALTHVWSGKIAYTFDRLPHVGVADGMHYAMGYCGSGVVMSSWLGRKAALRLLGAPDAASAFAELSHPGFPLYQGRPWFLPLVQAWYQGADMLGR